MDDQYFQFHIAFRGDLEDEPLLAGVKEAILRGLDRSESAGFLQGLLERTRFVVETSPNATARMRLQANPNWHRIDAVVRRIVKGLYYREFGRAMPTGRMDVFDDLGEFTPDSDMQAIFPLTSILESLRAETPRVIAPDVFEYRFAFTVGAPEVTTWLLTFYSRAWFLVFANWERFASR